MGRALLVPVSAGIFCTMADIAEKRERDERAGRLVVARKRASFKGPKAVTDNFGWSLNNYKAHESGRNGFGLNDAKRYARAFNVSLQWLNFGIGTPDDEFIDADDLPVEVSIIDWISAGDMKHTEASDVARGKIKAALPEGDWIALEVDGESMDRISPPGSIIFVDRSDTRLSNGGFYVIADENGDATYKRYRPKPMRFEPVSANKDLPTLFPDNEPIVIGRVKLTMLNLT